MRVGSRHNALLSALLAAADAGACTLPPGMVENRARLASMQAVAASALRAAPEAEMRARDAAVQALVGDPAEDVIDAVLKGRQIDAEHRLRVELLSEAADLAADQLDALPDDLTAHLQAAFDDCLDRLTGSYAVFSPISARGGDDLLGESKKVRDAWSEFCRAVRDHGAIRTVWGIVRATSPSQLDTEDLFAEFVNLADLWPERCEGLLPISVMKPPWPRRSDPLDWTLWMVQHNAELYLPTVEQQDLAWDRVFGERFRQFALGDRHVAEMRQIFG